MQVKTRRKKFLSHKKPSQKFDETKVSDGEVSIKFLLQHLNYPISIFDFRKKKFIYVNQQFTQVTGLSAEECYNMDLDEFLTRVQSHDLLALQKEIRKRLEKAAREFINTKNRQLSYSMNCRFKQKDGTFSDIMVQCTVMEWDEHKYPAVTLNLYTDLTPHKRDLKIALTISVLDETNKEWKTVLSEEFLRIPEMLTEHERDIMTMMVHDVNAEDIAVKLDLKFYTVRAHWRNILGKTGCKSQKELKELAQHEGWV